MFSKVLAVTAWNNDDNKRIGGATSIKPNSVGVSLLLIPLEQRLGTKPFKIYNWHRAVVSVSDKLADCHVWR